ncbi:MAG TPA: matrixin family metalloprotease [Mycobacteriales bacterium]|jgi:hypothetical protein|nr:matrixin family metalloprotease [Mycobacteriales bacterium]
MSGYGRAAWAAGVLVATMLPAPPASAYVYYPGGCHLAATYSLGVANITFKGVDVSGYTTLTGLSAGRWNNVLTGAKLVTATTTYTVYATEMNFGSYGGDGTHDITCATSGGTFAVPSKAYANTYYTNTYSNPQRFSVMVHELGHVLGLDHNNDHGNCSVVQIMYVSIDRYDNCGVEYPKSDDVAGVESLY